MSEPNRDAADALRGAMSELVSAQSALNMVPDPIIVADKPDGGPIYLSECDSWAAHSYEHITAAFDLLMRACAERDQLRARIHQLEHDLANVQTANKMLEASLKMEPAAPRVALQSVPARGGDHRYARRVASREGRCEVKRLRDEDELSRRINDVVNTTAAQIYSSRRRDPDADVSAIKVAAYDHIVTLIELYTVEDSGADPK